LWFSSHGRKRSTKVRALLPSTSSGIELLSWSTSTPWWRFAERPVNCTDEVAQVA
jgi:hypothetical protein